MKLSRMRSELTQQSQQAEAQGEQKKDGEKNIIKKTRGERLRRQSLQLCFLCFRLPWDTVGGWLIPAREGNESPPPVFSRQNIGRKTPITQVSNECFSRVNLIYLSSLGIGVFCPSKFSLGKHTGQKSMELPHYNASLNGHENIPRI